MSSSDAGSAAGSAPTFSITSANYDSNAPIEDTFVIEEGDDFIYAGVFDGHGGAQASIYCRENSWAVLQKHIAKQRKSGRVDFNAALQDSLIEVDAMYISQAKDRRRGMFAGTCAICVYIDKPSLTAYVANLGDSRVILVEDEDAKGHYRTRDLTEDHSAGRDKERQRERALFPDDPTVITEDWDEFLLSYTWLVKNICMFTRSIGDAYMKVPVVADRWNKGIMDAAHKVLPLPSKSRPYISSVPEMKVVKLSPKDKNILLACDGLWDEMASSEAGTKIMQSVDGDPAGDHATDMIDYAIERATERIQTWEPELGIRNSDDLRAIPPGSEGRKYLHDDITVINIVINWGDSAVAERKVATEKARKNWDTVRRAVDFSEKVRGRGLKIRKWHSLVDDVTHEDEE